MVKGIDDRSDEEKIEEGRQAAAAKVFLTGPPLAQRQADVSISLSIF